MREPAITPELIARHGLTPEEYARVTTILGRAPNFTELGIFSVMWSEHCSYKSSRVYLATLPTTGPCTTRGPLVGNLRRCTRLDLYEQCSDHITEKIPSSV